MTQPVSAMSSRFAITPYRTTTMSAYVQPSKRIVLDEHLELFKQSSTFNRILEYIDRLNKAVVGVKLTDEVHMSDGVHRVLRMLDEVESIAKSTPPVDNKLSRFGNPGFRDFVDRVTEASTSLHKQLNLSDFDAVNEISTYFNESWGNRQRIDYGSGMELNFVCWLICLEELGVFDTSDDAAIVTRVFWKYISIMRTLQSTFWLEPAGSHGVWGLDDYHFLPFLWGAGQLSNHKYLRPKSIHDAEVMLEFSDQYMYLSCIKFINSIKTASLRWHSPMLDDISAVKTWHKVNEGMFKMYRVEVLSKLPIVQHFLFGSILRAPEGVPVDGAAEVDECGHAHSHTHAGHVDRSQHHGTFGSDCCGIPVPSAFGEAAAAAAASSASSKSRTAIRRIPFD
ncbi:hypothetical protein E3P99_03552 [Wallemia hederae]|uniref:Serine/threonine-protein phosphatase 2A activator n=1 Tax=Wallemia hederae TaxID=1540922 RepID=A0A4T0FJC3_9BASI|nr:hypothetical protein E3P99_03552 [Wallemia hederae]